MVAAPGRRKGASLARASRKTAQTRNRILAGLPRNDLARILPDLTQVGLEGGQILYEPGSTMHWAYFLETAIVSILFLAEDGTSIEVSSVGTEGVVGVPIMLKSNASPYRIVVQGPGTASRMKADVLRREFDRCGAFHKALLRYVHVLIVQLSQSSVCNRFHSIRERLCRWLLASHDRAGALEVKSTQEFLAQMLGVNRGSASEAASALQKAGLIRYTRGKITVLDRRGLEAAACECYQVVKAESGRLFHP
jgi:CRP-like cAMP-binding protein